MSSRAQTAFLGQEHDCYHAIDPRQNSELASSLREKNVVVAGAGRGIGQACAKFLAHAAARSLTLIALELNEVKETAEACEIIKPDILIKTAALNVCDAAKVEAIMAEVDRDFGGVDVLVMNAGRPPQWLPTARSDPKIWWDTVSVSLQGAFNFSRFALPSMQKKNDGRIIFTASAGAHSNFGMASYTVGKLGMVRLCEILHQENFKQYNIKTFAFNPGRVQTRFVTDFEDYLNNEHKEGSYLVKGLEGEKQSAETVTKAFASVTWDKPELAAGLVSALASGKLDFMSGRYIDASQNVSEYIKEKDKIQKEDLHRVRLHVGQDWFIPASDF